MSNLIPLRTLKAKPLSSSVVANWVSDGSPYANNPFRWEVVMAVTPQPHSSPLTPTPYSYDGRDIKVGDWFSNALNGLAWRVVSISSAMSTTVVCVMEDVEQYNTYTDPQISGDGGIPLNVDGFVFRLDNNGLPILQGVTLNVLTSNWQSDLQGRFTSKVKPAVYELPTATASTPGLIKPGSYFTVDGTGALVPKTIPLNVQGDTMQGPLALQEPSQPEHAARKMDVDQVSHRVDDHDNDIHTALDEIQSINSTLVDVQSDIGDLDHTLAETNITLGGLVTSVGTVASDIIGMKIKDQTLTSDLATLVDSNTTLTNDLTALDMEVTAGLASLGEKSNTSDLAIADLRTQTTNLDGRITILTTTVQGKLDNSGTLPANYQTLTINADQSNTRITNAATVQAMIERVNAKSLTMAALRARLVVAPNATNGSYCFLAGWRSTNDGGQGVFIWDSGSTVDDDGGIFIRPDSIASSSPGRWRRLIYTYEYDLNWFGGIGTNTSIDNRSYILALLAACVRDKRPGKIRGGTYVTSPFVVPTGMHVINGDGIALTKLVRKAASTEDYTIKFPVTSEGAQTWSGITLSGANYDNTVGSGIVIEDAGYIKFNSTAITNGDFTVTFADVTGLAPGMSISGPVPSFTAISSISGNTVTLSKAINNTMAEGAGEFTIAAYPNLYAVAPIFNNIRVEKCINYGIYCGIGRGRLVANWLETHECRIGLSLFRCPDHRIRQHFAGNNTDYGVYFEGTSDSRVETFAYYYNGEAIRGVLSVPSGASFHDGSIDGNKTHGVNLIGKGIGNTTVLDNIRFAGNSVNGTGLYSDIRIENARGVMLSNMMHAGGNSTQVKYCVEAVNLIGPIRIKNSSYDRGNRVPYSVAPTSDKVFAPMPYGNSPFETVTFAELQAIPINANELRGMTLFVSDRNNKPVTNDGTKWRDAMGSIIE